MLRSREDNARLNSVFYRNAFRKTIRWLIASMFITFALILAIIYLILVRPSQLYFANTTDGHILPMPSVIEGT